MANSNTIRIGMVGLGGAADHQLAALPFLPDLRIVGACDSDPSKWVKIRSKVPCFTRLEDLLRLLETDVVFVSTPPATHYQIVKMLLGVGQNVLLEKPATLSLKELEDLIDISRRKHLFFKIAFHAASGQEMENVEKWVGSREDIISIRSSFYDPYTIPI